MKESYKKGKQLEPINTRKKKLLVAISDMQQYISLNYPGAAYRLSETERLYEEAAKPEEFTTEESDAIEMDNLGQITIDLVSLTQRSERHFDSLMSNSFG